MLKELGIRNFVLIEDLRLEFAEGLNVLTGETGAGKSIVLDAVGLLAGDRFKTELIRQAAYKCEIYGLFDAPKTREFIRWLEDHGFEKCGELLIRREGSADGRSRAFLNDRIVTTGTLQELAAFLFEIHGQREHQQILQPSVQLASLDRFAGLEQKTAEVAPLYHEWRRLLEALTTGRLSEQERIQRIDLCQYQLSEIEKAKLKIGEEEELAARLPELKNAEKLRALAASAAGLLSGDDASAAHSLAQAEKNFNALAGLTPAMEPLARELSDLRARFDDINRQFEEMSGRWEADPQELENLLNRQDLISRLQKKYGAAVSDILAHAGKLREELDQLENTDLYRRDLEGKTSSARQALARAAEALSARRKNSARQLSQAMKSQLADLGLQQAVFHCAIETLKESSPLEGEDKSGGGPPSQPSPSRGEGEYRFSTTGIDRVSFEWSPNPGEGVRPLKDTASGGEMSRVMLALKTVLAQADAVPILVFDEVDAGIGGMTAQAVGKKLRALSRHHQLLCVSHLPQIASAAHAHFQVSKKTEGGRTTVQAVRLGPTERLNEIARLLGSAVTPTSVKHARELLEQHQ
jgi:DNA repair protein RecN (Recombination protein N)